MVDKNFPFVNFLRTPYLLSRNIDFSYTFYAKKRLVILTDSTYPESAPGSKYL